MTEKISARSSRHTGHPAVGTHRALISAGVVVRQQQARDPQQRHLGSRNPLSIPKKGPRGALCPPSLDMRPATGCCYVVSDGFSDGLFRLLDIHARTRSKGTGIGLLSMVTKGSQPRCRHFYRTAPPEPADHLPTEEDFLMFQDLIPLAVREKLGKRTRILSNN